MYSSKSVCASVYPIRMSATMCVNHLCTSNRNCLFIVNRLQNVPLFFLFFFIPILLTRQITITSNVDLLFGWVFNGRKTSNPHLSIPNNAKHI